MKPLRDGRLSGHFWLIWGDANAIPKTWFPDMGNEKKKFPGYGKFPTKNAAVILTISTTSRLVSGDH